MPGQLDQIFKTISLNEAQQCDSLEVLSRNPWLISCHGFLTPKEADIMTSRVSYWEQSLDQERVITSRCGDHCQDDPYFQAVTERIEDTTTIPSTHFESLQLFKYQPGQFSSNNQDTTSQQFQQTSGARILTLLLFLSDVEEDGGEVVFPTLGQTIRPKKGMAVIWPGVLNGVPTVIDKRTIHNMSPVKGGINYVAKAWGHQYDFQTSKLWNCSGSLE
jgi:hypothetical protein